jgi:hypothetical protein
MGCPVELTLATGASPNHALHRRHARRGRRRSYGFNRRLAVHTVRHASWRGGTRTQPSSRGVTPTVRTALAGCGRPRNERNRSGARPTDPCIGPPCYYRKSQSLPLSLNAGHSWPVSVVRSAAPRLARPAVAPDYTYIHTCPPPTVRSPCATYSYAARGAPGLSGLDPYISSTNGPNQPSSICSSNYRDRGLAVCWPWSPACLGSPPILFLCMDTRVPSMDFVLSLITTSISYICTHFLYRPLHHLVVLKMVCGTRLAI